MLQRKIRNDVRDEVNKLLQFATAQNTQDTYRQGLTCCDEFRSQFKVEKLLPPPLEHVVQFIGYICQLRAWGNRQREPMCKELFIILR